MIEKVPSDDNLVMISALQHYLFCRRQCALIHLERLWTENYLTATGRVLHKHVDERESETRKSFKQACALRLVSKRLGIIGVADMVEFYEEQSECNEDGMRVAARLNGRKGFWRPFPVEYKRGKPKAHRADEVQLCAQAFALEEMLNVVIPEGALFYGETRKRLSVVFDAELRALTQEVADGVHNLLDSGITPPPVYEKHCAACSMVDDCFPKIMDLHKSAKQWLQQEMESVEL